MDDVGWNNTRALLGGSLPLKVLDRDVAFLVELEPVDGGLKAFKRPVRSDPEVAGPSAWQYFNDRSGGDPFVFTDAVNQYLDVMGA
jgi:hypothetical protein